MSHPSAIERVQVVDAGQMGAGTIQVAAQAGSDVRPTGVDEVMKRGRAHPMGPLVLADLIGLDTRPSILEVLHEGFGDPKYRPCPLLKRYVETGRLGRKSGRGSYEYAPEG